MKRTILLILTLSLLCAGFPGCGKEKGGEPEPTLNLDWAENPDTEEVKKTSSGMRDIAFDEQFLSYIAAHTEGNYMVSPLSFRYALGLLLAGAEGETKTELLNALGVSSAEDWAQYCKTFNGFTQYFDEMLKEDVERFNRNVENGYIPKGSAAPFRALRVANSVWKREDLGADFKESYRDAVSRGYGAEYAAFTPENAVRQINLWASTKTEKMIENLLPDNYDTSGLAVVLMNALYFKDSWLSPFSSRLTKDGDFTTENGGTVRKAFMKQTDTLDYYADDETQLVILPMEGGISMAFVLGSTAKLAEKVSAAELKKVTVTIPKLDLESSFDHKELMSFLTENGVQKAFTGKADFSGMIDAAICVDDIIQKTRLTLDEDGAEAAAVTTIMMNEASAVGDPEQPVEFTADRPFSFYLYTTCNDVTAMLFAGEIVE